MSSELKTDVIINRDALYALRELPGESVNCCVTSPPYAPTGGIYAATLSGTRKTLCRKAAKTARHAAMSIFSY